MKKLISDKYNYVLLGGLVVFYISMLTRLDEKIRSEMMLGAALVYLLYVCLQLYLQKLEVSKGTYTKEKLETNKIWIAIVAMMMLLSVILMYPNIFVMLAFLILGLAASINLLMMRNLYYNDDVILFGNGVLKRGETTMEKVGFNVYRHRFTHHDQSFNLDLNFHGTERIKQLLKN